MSETHDATGSAEGDGPLRLAPVLDLSAAAPLAESLLARRGAAILIDASDVRRFGGQCLQVLLAARNQWRLDGASFALVAPSEAFADTLALFGADLETTVEFAA